MDPNATLNLINEAIEDGELGEALYLYEDLLEWLESGGAMPDEYAKAFTYRPNAIRAVRNTIESMQERL